MHQKVCLHPKYQFQLLVLLVNKKTSKNKKKWNQKQLLDGYTPRSGRVIPRYKCFQIFSVRSSTTIRTDRFSYWAEHWGCTVLLKKVFIWNLLEIPCWILYLFITVVKFVKWALWGVIFYFPNFIFDYNVISVNYYECFISISSGYKKNYFQSFNFCM